MEKYLISDFSYGVRKSKWNLFLNKNVKINLQLGLVGCYAYYQDGKLIGITEDDILTMFEGYSWDGCSPSFMFFGIRIGTPTPKKTKLASLTHDFLCQFLDCEKWTRKQADDIFYNIMDQETFEFRGMYHSAVVELGMLYRAFIKKNTGIECLEIDKAILA